MSQLLFIETFVFGASTIAAVYHLVLFLQQRDKFLVYYSIYLFSLSIYIGFKLVSDNYSPFEPSEHVEYFLFEEILQISMVCIYTTFAAVTLEVTFRDRYVMILWLLFLCVGVISIGSHVFSAIGATQVVTTRFYYGLSRFCIISIATVALILVWRLRKTPFQRTIIIGSFVYDFSGFLSAFSFATDSSFLGLKGVEPYLVGCLADIIIFSSAFGYRIKKVAAEKNALLRTELENHLAVERMRANIASNLHDDVGSTLSSINIYSESVKHSILNGDKEKAIGMLTQLGDDARHTIASMSDIVWAINPRNDSADKLISRMKSLAAELCSAKGIQLNMEFDEGLLNYSWSMTTRSNIFLIYKEALINSLKYAELSSLEVSFKAMQDFAVLQISDDGKGFNSEQWIGDDYTDVSTGHLTGGNGLRNMKERASEMKSDFSIVSSSSGTRICLEIPAPTG